MLGDLLLPLKFRLSNGTHGGLTELMLPEVFAVKLF